MSTRVLAYCCPLGTEPFQETPGAQTGSPHPSPLALPGSKVTSAGGALKVSMGAFTPTQQSRGTRFCGGNAIVCISR